MCIHVGLATRDTIQLTRRTTIADHRATLEGAIGSVSACASDDAVHQRQGQLCHCCIVWCEDGHLLLLLMLCSDTIESCRRIKPIIYTLSNYWYGRNISRRRTSSSLDVGQSCAIWATCAGDYAVVGTASRAEREVVLIA